MASFLSLFKEKKSNSSVEELIRNRAPISGLISQNNFGFRQTVIGEHVLMEIGQGQPIIFCHGLFGSFRNFAQIGQALAGKYRVIVPCMPMYDVPLVKCTVEELGFYLETFIEDLGLENCILVGNSMGGGTVLTYALRNPRNVGQLILFASSGLSFIPMRGGFMRLKEFAYVKTLMSDILFDASHVPDDEIREVYDVMQNKQMLLRCLSFTRSTKRNFLHEPLKGLDIPSLVIWGQEDKVTPPFIAEEFRTHLKNSEVHYLPLCGHVPPYEKPEECLALIRPFLERSHSQVRQHHIQSQVTN
jgi:2-hydroxy-6-oxonona-2,4-dienedioate hydrolase